jgi:hypothetical protein
MSISILVTAAMCFLIVLVAMALLAGVSEALRRLARSGRGAAADSGVAGEGLPPHLVAVITAAAAEAIGAPVVVHRVRVPPGADRWSRAGRMDIMDSHRLGSRR